MITLGIIGVVASIVIPQVVVSYSKKVTVNKLRKNYAIIQQAIKRSELDNEPVLGWDTSLNGHEFFERYFKNYFSNATEISSADIVAKVSRKNLNGTPHTGSIYGNSVRTTNFLINDGSMITIHQNNHGVLWIGIDTNGFSEPNTLGKDTFLFFFSSKSGLRPYGDPIAPERACINCTREKMLKESVNACNRQALGYWCAYLIINDGWEIRKDYPW